jgi:integrase
MAGKSGRASPGQGREYVLPSGRIGIQLQLGGKRYHVTGDTKTQARLVRDELLAQHRARQLGDPAARRLTVGQYLAGWLDDKRREVEPSSWRQYRNYLTKHVVPRVGTLKLPDLTTPRVRALYRELALETGLAPQSRLHAHRALSQAMRRAVSDGLLPRNPCEGVSPGRVPRGEARALTADEARRLLTASEGDWRCLWLLGLTTGLRLGELLGLCWDAVTLSVEGPDGADVAVRRALVLGDDNLPVLKPYPKNASSRRAVPLQPEAAEALRDQQHRQKLERVRSSRWEERWSRVGGGLVFRTRVGTPLLEGNAIRALKADAARAGVSLRRGEAAHLLRHTFASTLLAQGRPVTEVAMLMGHSSPAVTMLRYAHWVKGDLGQAREAIRRGYGLG